MASNLASARLATAKNPRGPVSSGPPPMPPPRRHRARSPLHHHHHPLQQQRTADSSSPSRDMQHPQPSSQHTGMMQRTFRAPPTALSDDEEQRRHAHRHRKKTLGGKKHAHHEGSRRRWRDEVSVRERRRYEAVWASNRGLFLRKGWALQHEDNWKALDDGDGQQLTQADLSRAWDGPEAELVVNLVVRDIWSRSRLPKDELAEVWELVDRGRRGALDKQEFVVGMWLVDQRLRGRKIPARVGESVWENE
ncbi:hypothetical protein B0T17DRAFT_279644 [Bombardia bombarda]|uniref:EH domain-containing protein n=1 Tax=Bombardia bombarda TaxID=252184 RepID=A0AA39WTA6_9PEZI|nr:hypothetical protein B0T17DRAFT_279644 [Bombardia bombarda]